MRFIAFVIVPLFIFLLLPATNGNAEDAPVSKPTLVVKYGDGKAEGKKSIAGTGEMIEFATPSPSQKLAALRIHCGRYGHPKAPDEDVEFSIVSADESEVVHQEGIAYSKFKRGTPRWTTIKFEQPIDVPAKFWAIMDFNAQSTKGVYVSYDSSTEGKHSKTGVPGGESAAVKFGGDWMVQAVFTRPVAK